MLFHTQLHFSPFHRYGDSSSSSASALASKKVHFDPRAVGDQTPLSNAEIADFASGLVKVGLLLYLPQGYPYSTC